MGWVYAGIDDEEFTREYGDLTLIRRMLIFVIPFKYAFLVVILAIVMQSIVTLLAPLALTIVIEQFELELTSESVVLAFSFIYLVLNALIFLFYFLFLFAEVKVIPEFMVNIRTTVFNHFQKQDMRFFDTKRSGNLSSRVGGDAAQSAEIVFLLTNFIGNFILIIFSFIILTVISPYLSFVILAIAPMVIILAFLFRRIARTTSRTFRKTEASVNSAIAESVEGIQIAKSYGRENKVINNFEIVNKQNYRSGLKLTLIMMILFPAIDFFLVIATWLILNLGGQAAISSLFGITGSTIYLFVLYLGTFFLPLMTISTFYSQLQSGFAAFERIVTVLDVEPEIKQNEDGLVLEDIAGEIRFENVTFAYKAKNDTKILENFNLTIKAGERLAIVGHTGAGKSTIINLISRFYEYQGGTIYIDGHDIRTLKLKSYMKHLGIVQQDPFLFAGTVRENIKYGVRDATEDEVIKAIDTVQAGEFIEAMSEGLDTDVHERGSRLSTGQRQLVCFARAILANPKILILDEATSSVDAYTESVIQDALETLMENRTSIVVAHRLSTIVNSDRIIVLDKGKIVEEGTHFELINTDSRYKKLYDIYFSHQAVDWEPLLNV